MLIKFNPSGTSIHKGLLKVRLDLYPEEGDLTYQLHHVYVPIIPEGGYPYEVNGRGSPISPVAYQAWLDSLPHIWRVNPCLCHFVSIDEGTKLSGFKDFVEQTFDKDLLATLDNTLVLPDSVHRLHFMRSKFLSKNKMRTKDYPDLLNSVNKEFRNYGVILNSKGKFDFSPSESIDIGAGATDRATYASPGETFISLNNPANATGSLDTLEIWAYSNMTGCKIGTAYGSGTDYTTRDVEVIGNVTSGSKQTFTGKDCDVETGDFLASYYGTGGLECDNGSGMYYKSGDQFGAGQQTYTAYSYILSLYGTGVDIVDVSLSDGIDVGDTPAESTTASLSLSDGMEGGTALSGASVVSLLEGLDLGDIKTMLTSLSKADGLNLGDTPSEASTMSVTVSDSLILSDIATMVVVFYLALTEGLVGSDSRAESMMANLSISDIVDLGDTPLISMLASVVKTEGLEASDTLSVLASVLVTDNIELGQNLILSMLASLSKTDGASLGESLALEALMSVQAQDSHILSDSKALSMLANVITTEGLEVSDTVIEELTAYVSTADGLSVGDTLLITKIGMVLKVLALTTLNRKPITIVALNRLLKTLIGGGS